MQPHQENDIARAEFVETGGGKRAYYAVPAGNGPFPGVLVFQEAFGVNDYVQGEVRRLAEHGYAAIAPDLFDGETFSYDDRDGIFPRLSVLTDNGMLERVNPAVAFLDAQPEVKKSAYGAVGFCMGGRLAVAVALELGEKIAAAASFYGGGIAPDEQRFFTPLLDRLRDVKGELLLIYGGEDASIAPKEHARIAEALSTHKKQYTLTVYPGAQHGFASRDRTAVYNADAAEKAWAQTLALFDRTLK
ncbi:MAG: carboxymethylenebutenolidase [Candidatus Eremiobacteraeota bacterium]|nr:carboxymethylenebutenolidase [Candidatus Eremiobacteraeota bacterium]